jgi:hypothetical protein
VYEDVLGCGDLRLVSLGSRSFLVVLLSFVVLRADSVNHDVDHPFHLSL